jgi:hypothetical protein
VPEYQAWELLRNGTKLRPDIDVDTLKLDRAALREMFGDDFHKTMPKLRGLYRAEGGVHPSAVAEVFGIASGDQLIKFINENPTRLQTIDQLTKGQLAQEFPDVFDQGQIEKEAMNLAHNDARLRVLEREAATLNRITGSDAKLRRRMGKMLAERILGQRTVRAATRTSKFAAAEARAGKAAERANLQGIVEEAAVQKRHQVMQHHLYKESARLADYVEKSVRYMKKFSKRSTLKNIDPEYVAQIDGLLHQIDLKKMSLPKLADKKALAAFIEEQQVNGLEVFLPQRVQNEARTQHYTELTIDEFKAFVDSIKSLEHVGRQKVKNDQRFKQMSKEVVDSITLNTKRKELPLHIQRSSWYKVKGGVQSFHAAHLKPEFVFEWLDGNQSLGASTTNLYTPVAVAQGNETTIGRWMAEGFKDNLDKLTPYERSHLHSTSSTELGTLSRESLIMLALHWGNEHNRQAVIEARAYQAKGWTQDKIESALGLLSSTEWDFVEATWQYIDRLWNDMQIGDRTFEGVASLQKRLVGIVPEKVQAHPFTIGNRTISGGYMPLIWDQRESRRAEELSVEEKLKSSGMALRSTTQQGHTHERLQNSGGLPPLLEMSAISEHVRDVVHDLTHREAVYQVQRLLQDPDVERAIKESAGEAFYKYLTPWIANIAQEQTDPGGAFGKIARYARVGTTTVAMGLKLSTALLQPFGFTQSIALLGEKYAFKGLIEFYTPWKLRQNVKRVLELSQAMNDRKTNFDRDVHDVVRTMSRGGKLKESMKYYFYLIGFFDMAVSMPTWLGAYEKGLVDFKGDEQRAILFADRSVRLSQGAGAPKDLAAIQRGPETHRIFTMFYSYFSSYYNMNTRMLQVAEPTPGGAFRLMMSALYLTIIPALLTELFLERGPEDEDEWASWAAKKLAAYPFQGLVGVRDVANFIFGDYGYSFTPVADAAMSIGKTAINVGEVVFGDEDWDRAATRDALLTLGYWGHLPARQAWLTGEYLYDWIHNDINSFSPWELLVTGTRGDENDR